VILKKLDRQFRKLTKFHTRKYIDPTNHVRREKRMLDKANKRWDGAYTIFSSDLTEEEQRYRDYFETDLQNYREDERIEEFLDKQ
jgi:KaiC/GvpD/RAD55 family RecA-like ATPase